MFGNIYGLDLGTYEIKVYDKKKNAIWREKNTIAIANEDEIFSVGDEAKHTNIGKISYNIESIKIYFPLVNTSIESSSIMSEFQISLLLKHLQQF